MLQRAAEAPETETRPRELGEESRSAALWHVRAGAGALPLCLGALDDTAEY